MIDAHNHLYEFAQFGDIAPVLQRAAAVGITRMLCNAGCEIDWNPIQQLATEHPGRITPAFGIHPWYAADTHPGWLNRLREQLDRTNGAIIGEAGLDNLHEPRNLIAQELTFRDQLQLAAELNLPIVVHCVRAWEELLRILKQITPLPPAILFHAYSGGAQLVPNLLCLNGWFSFAGTVLAEHNHRARESLAIIPTNRLLLETDAPDLVAPPAYRTGKIVDEHGRTKSEPADLRLILGGVAVLLHTSPDKLESLLETNLNHFMMTRKK